jgi:hypothetical protein
VVMKMGLLLLLQEDFLTCQEPHKSLHSSMIVHRHYTNYQMLVAQLSLFFILNALSPGTFLTSLLRMVASRTFPNRSRQNSAKHCSCEDI